MQSNPTEGDVREIEYDVIIVGAGITGLATAASLVDSGAHVAVLEKTASVGGTSALSGGWFAFSETPDQERAHIDDTDGIFIQDMVDTGEGLVDLRLLHALADEQHEAYEWLHTLGIEFDVVKLSSGQTIARSHHAPIGMVLAILRARLGTDPRIELKTNHRVTDLVAEGTHVVGVDAEDEQGPIRMMAGLGVVITTGGFTRSPELIGRFAPDQVDAMPYGAWGNTGDGLTMATKIGAGVRDMELLSGTYGSHPETTMEEHELLTAFYMGAIIVNTDGKRFVDESISYKQLGTAVLRERGQLAFEVFDSRIRAKSQPGVPLSDIGHIEEKGHVLSADSLDALAAQMAVPAQSLRETIDAYNRGVEQNDDEFGRSGLCNGVGELLTISAPPFYAYPAKTLMTSTYCGLTVDPSARVLDVEGTIISGLYAAGEVVGGFHGAGYMTGTALSKGVIFGRVIARELQSQLNHTAR